jgi:hypothetical protein
MIYLKNFLVNELTTCGKNINKLETYSKYFIVQIG